MTPEAIGLDITKILQERGPFIPSGIKRYINSLHESGQLIPALTTKKRIEEIKSAGEKIEDEIRVNLRRLLLSEKPDTQAIGAFRLCWILYLMDETSDVEMDQDITQIRINWPNEKKNLEKKEIKVINEYGRYAGKISNS